MQSEKQAGTVATAGGHSSGASAVSDTWEPGVLEEFQREFVIYWHRLPNKGFFFVLLAGWLLLFQVLGNSTFGYVDTASLFRWMFLVYTVREPDGSMRDDSIGFLVPVLVLGLMWMKRRELFEKPIAAWSPALGWVALGMVLHIVGYVIQQPRVSIVALFTGIYGLMGLAWGREWMRRAFFPYFLLVFCIPFSTIAEPVTTRLRLVVSQVVEWFSHYILAIEVMREGTILKNPANNYQYEIAAACSGIRSLITIGLMGVIGAFLYLKSWWRRGILVASVVPLAVLGNALRLLTIIIAAEIGGQDWGTWAHDNSLLSLLPYIPAFFGLMGIVKWLDEEKRSVSSPPNAGKSLAEAAKV